MKLHPDFCVCMWIYWKVIDAWWGIVHIFYILLDFLAYRAFEVSSWCRFGLRHHAVYWARNHYSLRWCYTQQRPASIEWICAEISILTIRMHTNTLIMIITCLGAPLESLAEERIDLKSRHGWKNPDDDGNDGWPLNQQAAICGLLLLSVHLLIHHLHQPTLTRVVCC